MQNVSFNEIPGNNIEKHNSFSKNSYFSRNENFMEILTKPELRLVTAVMNLMQLDKSLGEFGYIAVINITNFILDILLKPFGINLNK